ncbi:MAG TPA: alpha-ketoacid dehydrogenase subunit beta [Limnochordia bacterium]
MARVTYREALRLALREEMARDPRIFLLGEDIGAYGGSYAVTKGLLDEFGERRVRDTPISESVIAGVACGAAMGGLRPVAELMTINFALLAMDQIVNAAAKISYMFNGQFRAPLVIRTVGGGRRLAATHSQNLEVMFAFIPGLKVVTPATPADAYGLLKAAIRDDDPVIFIEHSLLYGTRGELEEGRIVPIGRSDVKRAGTDLTLIAYSRAAVLALEAAERLAEDGIDCEVIDLRTLRPLDMEPVLESIKKTHRAVVVEEDWVSYGIGAELAARIQADAFDELDAPVARVGAVEVPMPYAANLEAAALPDAAAVCRAARELLGDAARPAATGPVRVGEGAR